MAMDHVLPIAVVGMLFAELWASTAGLGFAMTVASATYQTDKAISVFLITVVVLAAAFALLRWILNALHVTEKAKSTPVAS
jgi:ABC-type nitrate/sulfonate/bicarbonate transport system permease component